MRRTASFVTALVATAAALIGTASMQVSSQPATRPVRIQPLQPAEWTDADREALGAQAGVAASANFIKVLLRHRDLWRMRSASGRHFSGSEATLSARLREILILRT